MKRKIVRRNQSKKLFKKGLGTKKKNVFQKPTRGGHRL